MKRNASRTRSKPNVGDAKQILTKPSIQARAKLSTLSSRHLAPGTPTWFSESKRHLHCQPLAGTLCRWLACSQTPGPDSLRTNSLTSGYPILVQLVESFPLSPPLEEFSQTGLAPKVVQALPVAVAWAFCKHCLHTEHIMCLAPFRYMAAIGSLSLPCPACTCTTLSSGQLRGIIGRICESLNGRNLRLCHGVAMVDFLQGRFELD